MAEIPLVGKGPVGKGDFVGETAPFAEMTKERLISELFTSKDLPRKTRIPNIFNQTALETLAFHFSDRQGRQELLPLEVLGERRVTIGSYFRAWIWFYKNNAVSHEGMSRAEYITALASAPPTEDTSLAKRSRLMGNVWGI